MLVYSLCKQFCPERIPCLVGSKLGAGVDGEVFNIVGKDSRVIKFCILYEIDSFNLNDIYTSISNTISYLIKHEVPAFARVYSHALMGQYSRTFCEESKQSYLLYYYIMEKLQKITDDEVKVFDTLVSHEDRNKKKDFSSEKIKEIMSWLARGLDFDEKKVILFYKNLKNSPVTHLDIHTRNIMKDTAGNFKLIDFDRTQLIWR